MVEVPNELWEVICAKPLIWPNCRSNGVVTDEAMTSGLAPGYWATTWIVGKSTAGGPNRQQHVAQQSHQQHAGHQQRRGHGPMDEWF